MIKLFSGIVGLVAVLFTGVAFATHCNVQQFVNHPVQEVRFQRVQKVVRLVEVPAYEEVHYNAPQVVERVVVRNVQKQRVQKVQVQKVRVKEVQRVQRVKEVQKVRGGLFNRNRKIVIREEVVH